MAIRWVRRAVFAFFLLYAVVVTWPGALPFSRAEPFLLGLPFSLAWAVLWILLGGAALVVLHLAEGRAARSSPDPEEG
jgi:TRAP-type C4-dicarboxylate transport system permease small subunit